MSYIIIRIKPEAKWKDVRYLLNEFSSYQYIGNDGFNDFKVWELRKGRTAEWVKEMYKNVLDHFEIIYTGLEVSE